MTVELMVETRDGRKVVMMDDDWEYQMVASTAYEMVVGLVS
jgi:hypothetical protein